LFLEITVKRRFFLSIVTILLAGCGTSSSTATQTPTLPPAETLSTLLEPTDHTQLIVEKAGEAFELVVPSNPSTGGVDVWRFRAVNPGNTMIALGHYPPGNATDPEETVTFSIRVE
jgi:predicted secreted protein